jgi:hypothetical protein
MSDTIRLLDVVAITVDLPAKGLRRGQVGTIVELLGDEAVEIEFSDDQGETYATVALRASQLLVLHDTPGKAAQSSIPSCPFPPDVRRSK